MQIYIVRAGDTIEQIAANYGVSVASIETNNGLTRGQNLVVGQALLILIPSLVHTVTEGQTLDQIAQQYGILVTVVLQNNPVLAGGTDIYPGEELVISYEGIPEEDKRTVRINGYAYPNIARTVLRETLPYLTYLTLFTYGFTPEGELVTIDDDEVIQIAREYGVAPLMLISSLTPGGGFSNELVHTLLENPSVQQTLFVNILENMQQKGYYGLDIDFEFVYESDREAFAGFIADATAYFNAAGYEVMTALAPKISAEQRGLLYEAHDYEAIGTVSNYVLLMTYEWGYTYGPPMAVAPINKVEEVLDYAVTEIAPEKIFMGIPNYGYDWTLPYVRNVSRAQSLGNIAAVQLAAAYRTEILYDDTAQTPYFYYTDSEGAAHVVWFEDVRSLQAKYTLVSEYGFLGFSYWNLMRLFIQSHLLASAMFRIEKLLA